MQALGTFRYIQFEMSRSAPFLVRRRQTVLPEYRQSRGGQLRQRGSHGIEKNYRILKTLLTVRQHNSPYLFRSFAALLSIRRSHLVG